MQELHQRFAALARERMVAAGWTWDEDADCAPDQELIATFHRPAAGEFVMTASFVREPVPARIVPGGRDPHPPPLVVRAVLGIRHRPADRLLRLLGDVPACAIGSEVGALLDPPRDSFVRVERMAETSDAVATLALPIEQHADRYAAEHASVEAMIAGWHARGPFASTSVAAYAAEMRACRRSGGGPLRAAKLPAVLLAATGRHEEARAALADALSRGDDDIDADDADADRRFARRLERWIDSGAAIPDEDVAPSRRRRPARERLSFAEIRRRSRERSAAVDAVRHAAHGKTRDELRALLETELSRRDLELEPIRIEFQLDDIQHPPSPLERVQGLARGVQTAVSFARGLKNILSDDAQPPPQPAWLDPPEHASYDVRATGGEETVVLLDEDATDWLERAHGAARMRIGVIASLDVWFSWAADLPDAERRIAVHVGGRRVGTLDRRTSEQLRPIMDVAAMFDELPRLRANLLRRSSAQRPFVLTLAA